ncbi:MAG TPA: VCBS repeat-containing protein [Anaerolineae bacterium]|nr:VCBS repeat-containing protein [Anaerolineae bacterium]
MIDYVVNRGYGWGRYMWRAVGWLVSVLMFGWLVVVVNGIDTGRAGGGLVVVRTVPAGGDLGVAVNSEIEILLEQPVAGVAGMVVGKWSGVRPGEWLVEAGGRGLRWRGERPFSAGEMVMVTIRATDGEGLPVGASYSFSFWARTQVTVPRWELSQTLSTRDIANEGTRAYGGVATDFNEDGWLDLGIINEDTADVRLFLNLGEGRGLFGGYLRPTTPVNQRASPNDVGDFNGDGHMDWAIANIDANTVSILLGNGDGTFEPQVEIGVGEAPRGLAVLDVDGDGDVDVVNTNSAGSGNLSLLVNDGRGRFGSPIYFEGGDGGEWGLAAADMNGDGLMDLVVGSRDSSPTVRVLLSRGDGTFDFGPAQIVGGGVWMLAVGDVNGDGHDDVVTVNGSNHNGSVLMGDGIGQLAPPVIYGLDALPIAVDLGDVDGDGDLDWVTSSYLGDFMLWENDGDGNFELVGEFTAPEAASCALLFDVDNDGDLDLALIDEEADLILVQKNVGERGFLPVVVGE